jgi:hypothetical protein
MLLNGSPVNAVVLDGSPDSEASANVTLPGVSSTGLVGVLTATVEAPPPTVSSPVGGGGGPGKPRPVEWDARVTLRGVSSRAAVGSLALWASDVELAVEEPAAQEEPTQPTTLLTARVKPLAEPEVFASASTFLVGLSARLHAPRVMKLGPLEAVFDEELEDAALLALEML